MRYAVTVDLINFSFIWNTHKYNRNTFYTQPSHFSIFDILGSAQEKSTNSQNSYKNYGQNKHNIYYIQESMYHLSIFISKDVFDKFVEKLMHFRIDLQ